MSRSGGRASAQGARQKDADDSDQNEVIDMHIVVEKLHDLSLAEILGKMPKIKQENKYAHISIHDNTPPVKVHVRDIIRSLPRHILACLVSRRAAIPPHATAITAQPTSTDCHRHIARAFSLLVTLCELCTNAPTMKDDGHFPPDKDFTAELIDATIFTLLTVSGPHASKIVDAATKESSFDEALEGASMVSSSLQALTFILSAQSPPEERPGSASRGTKTVPVHWSSVCKILLSHPRGGAFIRCSFESTNIIVRAVRAALVSESIHTSEGIYKLAFHAGVAMELVFQLCASPLLYQRMMLDNDDMQAPLRLILSCLEIHDTPLAVPPFKRSRTISLPGDSSLANKKVKGTSSARTESNDTTTTTTTTTTSGGGSSSRSSVLVTPSNPPYSTDKGRGAAELLAARGFALILILGEPGNPSYFDALAERNLEKTSDYFDAICERTKSYVSQVLLRPSIGKYPMAPGECQMAINVLRAAEFLSDDSNFKKELIPGLSPTLVRLLGQSNDDFRSMWCLGEQSILLMSDTSILINSCTADALKSVKSFSDVSKQYFQKKNDKGVTNAKGEQLSTKELALGRHLSLEMNILLSKLLVNLQYYDENTMEMEGKFLKKFLSMVRMLEKKDPRAMLACIARNLESLFRTAWNFGGERAVMGIELMNEMDMKFSKDLLEKVKNESQ